MFYLRFLTFFKVYFTISILLYRDVQKKMAEAGVSSITDFDWISQMRYLYVDLALLIYYSIDIVVLLLLILTGFLQ